MHVAAIGEVKCSMRFRDGSAEAFAVFARRYPPHSKEGPQHGVAARQSTLPGDGIHANIAFFELAARRLHPRGLHVARRCLTEFATEGSREIPNAHMDARRHNVHRE